MSRFRNRAVFITGASSGIGEYLARELVARGAKVGLLARRQERLEQLSEELGPERTAWAAADVTDGEAQALALDRLEAALGPPAAVVANAGFNRPEPAAKFTPGAARAIYDVNLLGFLHTVDWALPRFLERGEGQIVGIASVASFFGLPHNAAYCGSKAALRIHLQSLRASLPARGIAVTTICPGFVKSELTAKVSYPMPFLWETDRAARLMVDAMEKRKGEVVFPWQMSLAAGLLTRLPNRLAEWVSGRFLG
jgi:short-subunit dehydrogenase